jgi:hypothetical protein
MRFLRIVFGAQLSARSAKKAVTPCSMVILGAGYGAGGSGSRDGGGGSPAHERAVSHTAAIAFASSQLVLPVYLRLKTPLRVPDAKI